MVVLMNDYQISVKIAKSDIAYLIKILEGYENLGLVTTLNVEEGLVLVRYTPDTKDEIMTILNNFPKALTILEDFSG